MGPKLRNRCKQGHQSLGGTSSSNDKHVHQFKFNPSTSWGSYARHRHNLLHCARSMTDTRVWHKHTTGELKMSSRPPDQFSKSIDQNQKCFFSGLKLKGDVVYEIQSPDIMLFPYFA